MLQCGKLGIYANSLLNMLIETYTDAIRRDNPTILKKRFYHLKMYHGEPCLIIVNQIFILYFSYLQIDFWYTMSY